MIQCIILLIHFLICFHLRRGKLWKECKTQAYNDIMDGVISRIELNIH